MKDHLHTVLGASGAVGQAVVQELLKRAYPVRAVTRRSEIAIAGVEYQQADLTHPTEAHEAIAGSTYVYLCVGLPYRTSIWDVAWEQVMSSVIESCAAHSAKLIFLDNAYLYRAPLPIPFDEETVQQPRSNKGKARKRTADLMIQAIEEGKIEGLIGRASDFYGEGAVNSSLYISFLERMLRQKTPQSLTSPSIRHTYANVSDVGRALVVLALRPSAYGQAWHLPVGPPITVQEMLSLFNQCLGTSFRLSVLPKVVRKGLSVFVKPLKEVDEMLYQFEQEYVMCSDKFEKAFPDFAVTSYQEGVQDMVAWFTTHRENKSNL